MGAAGSGLLSPAQCCVSAHERVASGDGLDALLQPQLPGLGANARRPMLLGERLPSSDERNGTHPRCKERLPSADERNGMHPRCKEWPVKQPPPSPQPGAAELPPKAHAGSSAGAAAAAGADGEEAETLCDLRLAEHELRVALLGGKAEWPEEGEERDADAESAEDADTPAFERAFTEAEEDILKHAKHRWTLRQQQVDRCRRLSDLQSLLQQTRGQLLADSIRLGDTIPANRYGSDAELPAFVPGRDVPTLALINPHSGAAAGSDILAIARRSPYYQERFFNIIDVVKDQRRGGLLDVFRSELCRAKEEAKAMGTRARIISGGGDGTASFSLYVLFAALRADPSREDEGLRDAGNGFVWTDEEMEQCFPALAQMPLGSANDFGRTLGWGRKYPGDAEFGGCGVNRPRALKSLQAWIEAVISPSSKIANFDLFGIMPPEGAEACDFKVCELTGRRGRDPKVVVDGTPQLLMKEAGTPVPLFCCLYFSAGFAAYMTARFQINRRRTPGLNKMEYARQAAGIIMEPVPPQLHVGLEGVQITCGGEAYFPPRGAEGTCGAKYREVGFLNINWQAGMANGADRAPACARVFSVREPAKFNDGKMDMYRLKFASALKNPGLKIQTDKREGGMTLTYAGGRGKGVFFQWDGEARFAFRPSGEPFKIHIRKIVNVPVVLGPQYDARVTGDADNGEPVRFAFAGEGPAQREAVRQRLLRAVRGELNAELNATRAEICEAGLHCH